MIKIAYSSVDNSLKTVDKSLFSWFRYLSKIVIFTILKSYFLRFLLVTFFSSSTYYYCLIYIYLINILSSSNLLKSFNKQNRIFYDFLPRFLSELKINTLIKSFKLQNLPISEVYIKLLVSFQHHRAPTLAACGQKGCSVWSQLSLLSINSLTPQGALS